MMERLVITIIMTMDIDDRYNRIRLAQESYFRQTEHLHNELSEIIRSSPCPMNVFQNGLSRTVHDELTKTKIDSIKHKIEKIYQETLGELMMNKPSYTANIPGTSNIASNIDDMMELAMTNRIEAQVSHIHYMNEFILRDMKNSAESIADIDELSREQKLAKLNPSFKEFIKLKISRLKL